MMQTTFYTKTSLCGIVFDHRWFVLLLYLNVMYYILIALSDS